MKRTGIFLALLIAVGTSPLVVKAGSSAPVSAMTAMDELPWSVVDAVLKEVDEETAYVYSELVEWYYDALLTVEQSGSSYVVRIYDGDGNSVDVLIMDGV